MKKGKLVLASEEVEYDLIRSSRRTVALYIRPGGTLLIRAPWYVPVYVILHFVEAKAPWILKQRNRLKDIKPAHPEEIYADGAVVFFMGKGLTIRVCSQNRYDVSISGNELLVGGPGLNSNAKIKALIEKWYLSEAKKFFIERTYELVSLHGDKLPAPLSVGVRKMKSRWGTCKNNGAIWFNRELIKKDPELIDSVIIHELCHLVHHNHGKDFYSLLESIIPDYRAKRRSLRNL